MKKLLKPIVSTLLALSLITPMALSITAQPDVTQYTIPAGESAEFTCANGSSRELRIIEGEPVLITCHEDGTATVEPLPSETASATDTPTDVSTDSPSETATEAHAHTETATDAPTSTEAATATQTQTASATASMTDTLTPSFTASPTATASKTKTMTPSFTPSSTNTATFTPSRTPTRTPTLTPTLGATATPTSQGSFVAFPGAPLCPDHGGEHPLFLFHTVWDSARGCHYDHEHGQNPFTPEVAAAFPGMNLLELLCGNQVSHCNPSGPMEPTHKHGGYKWQVDTAAPKGCQIGFEDGNIAVKSYAIQFHAFGRQDVEHEARNHSSVALLALCRPDNPNDVGYLFVSQLQEYGQRLMQYQGWPMPYLDRFLPEYISPRGPYFTTECFGPGFTFIDVDGQPRSVVCRDAAGNSNNNNTIWTSKPTGNGPRPITPGPFRMLFRGRDNYQRVDVTDRVHPFTWRWVCGEENYNPTGCRFNSSTMTIHEVMGDIPAYWDNVPGWDTDPRPGRITAQGFLTRFGDRDGDTNRNGRIDANETPVCTAAVGLDCQPIKMIGAFVGRYSTDLCDPDKCSNPTPENTPERDIYFCNGVPCSEWIRNAAGNPVINPAAVPSGWIGSEN